ncbi:XRE family transcriptional regulator [Gordonia sputi]|uniref:XRE family transcriptional regulator n=1 Tax=Gordonia sputi TaxID=36823 RepID=UPI0036CBB03A
MVSTHPRAPIEYVAAGVWPEASLRDDAPVQVQAAQLFARNLRAALDAEGIGLRTLAKRVGINHATISRALAGLRFCDAATLAQLESGMDTALWPTYEATVGYRATTN